jgi:hypothetical protein
MHRIICPCIGTRGSMVRTRAVGVAIWLLSWNTTIKARLRACDVRLCEKGKDYGFARYKK